MGAEHISSKNILKHIDQDETKPNFWEERKDRRGIFLQF